MSSQPAPAGRPSSARAWSTTAATAAVAATAVGQYVLVAQLVGGVWAAWSYALCTTTTAGLALLGLRRHRPLQNGHVWRWLLVGLALYAVGDVAWALTYTATGRAPDVSLADVGWLAAIACLVVSGLELGRARLGARNADSLVDALCLGATLVLVLWVPVIEPGFVGAPLHHQFVLAAYPVVDVVLVAVLVRLAFGRRARSGASATCFAAASVMLSGDALYGLAVRNGWYEGGSAWLDVVFLVGLALWASVFAQPSLPTAAAPVDAGPGRISHGRLALSAVALTAAPVSAAVALVLGARPNPGVLVATSVIATGAVLWRARRLVDATVASRDGLRRAAAELDHQRAYFAELVRDASDVVLVLDAGGRVVNALGSTTAICGRAPTELVGRHAAALVHPDEVGDVIGHVEQVVDRPAGTAQLECRALHADGSSRWVSVRLANRLEGSEVGGVIVNVSDISDRKRAEQALAHQALHDGLTALANRVLLEDRLEHALAGERAGVALLYIDLDRFKVVNDSLGHAAGDQLLVAVADRFRAEVRATDTVARLGGDEFCIVVEEVDAGPEAVLARVEALAARVMEVVRRPVVVDGVEVVVGASVGLVVAAPGDTAAEVLRHGDLALYAAKAAGKDCARRYDEGMQRAASDRLALENDLRVALERDELVLHYQPIVDLRTDELAGFEALVRWQHPERGLLAPDRFIPIAEECGLIVPVGAWVLQEACRAAARWGALREGRRPLPMSVNVSSLQLEARTICDVVAGALAGAGLAPELLTLELTESTLVRDPDVARARLQALKALGVRIAVDDFGVGYSSVGYLREFPIDVLKIDRSFLHPVTATQLPAVLRGVLDLSATMGLATVAEGLESDDQRVPLLHGGCQFGQGHLFARPLVEGDAADLVLGEARGLPAVGVPADLADAGPTVDLIAVDAA